MAKRCAKGATTSSGKRWLVRMSAGMPCRGYAAHPLCRERRVSLICSAVCSPHHEGSRSQCIRTTAEQVVGAAEQVVPVRKDVAMDVLALIGCAVTTGVGAVVNAARVEPGSTVAVIGCGGVGLNVIQGAALVSAGRIIAVDLLDNKLEYARQFGATDTINASNGDAVEQVREMTGGGVDYAFEVIGNGKTVEQAIEMTRVAGTACIVGMAPQGSRASFDPLLFVNKETKLIGTWYGSARPRIDFPRMIELTLAGKLKVNELISRRYSLDQINEGFERLGRGEVARGVIVFDR